MKIPCIMINYKKRGENEKVYLLKQSLIFFFYHIIIYHCTQEKRQQCYEILIQVKYCTVVWFVNHHMLIQLVRLYI